MKESVHRRRRSFGPALCAVWALLLTSSPLRAEDTFHNPYQTRGDYASLLVIDAVTGTVLLQKDPDKVRAPASLTKMMTLYLLLDANRRGEVSLSDTLDVPWQSSKIGGSGVGLRSHEKMTLKEAGEAMIISSGNDAAIAIAEHLAGTEPIFANRMTKKAREIGMLSTRYINAHGLDGWSLTSLTTAHDLSVLARRLLQFPQTTQWCSRQTLTIRGGQVIHTTNRLLGHFEGMDGIKTGFTGPAGFCFVGTAERDSLRLISVVLGASTNEARFRESGWALTEAFHRYRRVTAARRGQPVGVDLRIEGAIPPAIPILSAADVPLVLPRTSSQPIRFLLTPRPLALPLSVGQPVGRLDVMVGDSLVARIDALAGAPARRESWWQRFLESLRLHKPSRTG
ncbi:MAG: D-alanyl-D-alanine carboxypeptidase [Candidatus Eisenbacteria bacterium]|uniref:serine-type D-Ala-D-Ala carboxypeptidase n=1 Tax=Eiseniibacteriota bacterium TaxID=2212470 RepID=A0A956M4Q1_UNCEI|nr:D-alanyl-D-alanine carboxypeptidase [Candidatus Eisenbacteria bacterium]